MINTTICTVALRSRAVMPMFGSSAPLTVHVPADLGRIDANAKQGSPPRGEPR